MIYCKFGRQKCLLIFACVTFYFFTCTYINRMNNERSTFILKQPLFDQENEDQNSGSKYEHSVPYNCTHETTRLNVEKTAQDDPRLIDLIKRCYLEEPSELPYNLEKPDRSDFSQGGQSLYVDELLNHAENGFFVESGAFDGEYLSNSLFFERERRWAGLLVEPVSDVYTKLRLKHRKSFCVRACLNEMPYSAQKRIEVNIKYPEVSKTKEGNITENQPFKPLASGRREEIIQCFPLYSILLATGHTRVDLFSLDVEGVEMEVLNTIPWDKVDIKVLIVEFNHLREGKAGLESFMEAKHYKTLPSLQTKGGSQDAIFMKNR